MEFPDLGDIVQAEEMLFPHELFPTPSPARMESSGTTKKRKLEDDQNDTQTVVRNSKHQKQNSPSEARSNRVCTGLAAFPLELQQHVVQLLLEDYLPTEAPSEVFLYYKNEYGTLITSMRAYMKGYSTPPPCKAKTKSLQKVLSKITCIAKSLNANAVIYPLEQFLRHWNIESSAARLALLTRMKTGQDFALQHEYCSYVRESKACIAKAVEIVQNAHLQAETCAEA